MYLWHRHLTAGAPLSPSRVSTTWAGVWTNGILRRPAAAVRAVAEPDAVQLVVAYLRAQHHLADATLVTARPDDLVERLPVLLVEPVGEPVRSRMPWARQVRWRLGLQAWAGDDEVEGLVRGALTALLAARGVVLPNGGRIIRVDPAADPTEVPDRNVGEGIRRVVATIDVSVRY